MPMIVQRGRNPIVAAAFAGLRAAERKFKKGPRIVTDPQEAKRLGVRVGDAVQNERAPADDVVDHQRAVEKVKKTLRKSLVSAEQVKVAPKKAPAAKKRASRKAKR